MDRKIVEFRRRCSEVTDILHEIQDVGRTSAEAQSLFFDSKSKILSLFEDENRFLHPVIVANVKDDPFLIRTASFFFGEVNACLEKIKHFYGRYPQPGSGLRYAEEFGIVFAATQQRVRLEQHAIYGIYDEVRGQTDNASKRKIA